MFVAKTIAFIIPQNSSISLPSRTTYFLNDSQTRRTEYVNR